MVLSLVTTLAGIGWEPTIRGWLTVALGSAVLMGSVWLILATNLGHRLGSLVSLAGFFAWMVIMGFVWWIYGIGRAGDPPEWVVVEFVTAESSLVESETGPASDLAPDTSTIDVTAAELVEQFCPGLSGAYADMLPARVDDPLVEFVVPSGLPGYCNEEVAELVTPDEPGVEATVRANNERIAEDDSRRLDEEELDVAVATAIDEENRKTAQASLSALKAVGPDLIADAKADGTLSFEKWDLRSTAEAGEAQAAADAWLVEHPDESGFSASGDFLLLNAWEQGGKKPRDGDGVWDRVWGEIRQSATILNPTKYSVVEVQRTLQKEQIDGAPPPFPEADPGYERAYVIMIRDLGDRRVPAAILTLASLAVFLGLALMLHRRDQLVRERTGA